MECELLTKRQETLIVDNIAAACNDIRKLNNTGYKFIYLCNGFIAHYDRFGFQDYYHYGHYLQRDILKFQNQNQYNNFQPGEENYKYYKQKARIYNKICKIINCNNRT